MQNFIRNQTVLKKQRKTSQNSPKNTPKMASTRGGLAVKNIGVIQKTPLKTFMRKGSQLSINNGTPPN